jgi:hypothetical protein
MCQLAPLPSQQAGSNLGLTSCHPGLPLPPPAHSKTRPTFNGTCREADKLENAEGEAAPIDDEGGMTSMNDKSAAVCVIDATGIIRMTNKASVAGSSVLID